MRHPMQVFEEAPVYSMGQRFTDSGNYLPINSKLVCCLGDPLRSISTQIMCYLHIRELFTEYDLDVAPSTSDHRYSQVQPSASREYLLPLRQYRKFHNMCFWIVVYSMCARCNTNVVSENQEFQRCTDPNCTGTPTVGPSINVVSHEWCKLCTRRANESKRAYRDGH